MRQASRTGLTFRERLRRHGMCDRYVGPDASLLVSQRAPGCTYYNQIRNMLVSARAGELSALRILLPLGTRPAFNAGNRRLCQAAGGRGLH
jgi:hypothetical protein